MAASTAVVTERVRRRHRIRAGSGAAQTGIQLSIAASQVRRAALDAGGVDVAMSISGHKTVSVFNRYTITSAADEIEALRKPAQHLAGQPTQRSDGAALEMRGSKTAAGK